MRKRASSVFASKTIWFSIALAVLAVIQGYLAKFELSPDHQMYIGLAIAIIVAVLRVITTASLFNPPDFNQYDNCSDEVPRSQIRLPRR